MNARTLLAASLLLLTPALAQAGATDAADAAQKKDLSALRALVQRKADREVRWRRIEVIRFSLVGAETIVVQACGFKVDRHFNSPSHTHRHLPSGPDVVWCLLPPASGQSRRHTPRIPLLAPLAGARAASTCSIAPTRAPVGSR